MQNTSIREVFINQSNKFDFDQPACPTQTSQLIIFRPNTTKRKWPKQLCNMKDCELLIMLLAPGVWGIQCNHGLLAEIWATHFMLDLPTEIPLVAIVCRFMK